MIGSFPKQACRDYSSPFYDSVRARRSPTQVYDSVAAADWLAQTCGDILTHWAYDKLEFDNDGLCHPAKGYCNMR